MDRHPWVHLVHADHYMSCGDYSWRWSHSLLTCTPLLKVTDIPSKRIKTCNCYYTLYGRLDYLYLNFSYKSDKWAPSSEFVSSSIPSWQILTAHAQPFRGAKDLAFCLKVPLDSLLVWAISEGSGETARMRRLAWTFAARIGDKNQIRLTRSK